MMNEINRMRQEDYSKDWVMHNGKSDVILRQEDESGRAMVMRDDEYGQVMEISTLGGGEWR